MSADALASALETAARIQEAAGMVRRLWTGDDYDARVAPWRRDLQKLCASEGCTGIEALHDYLGAMGRYEEEHGRDMGLGMAMMCAAYVDLVEAEGG